WMLPTTFAAHGSFCVAGGSYLNTMRSCYFAEEAPRGRDSSRRHVGLRFGNLGGQGLMSSLGTRCSASGLLVLWLRDGGLPCREDFATKFGGKRSCELPLSPT